MQTNTQQISNRSLAYNGALVSVAAVFFYAIVIMFYAVIRSSVTIMQSMQGSERTTILWASGFSMLYSVAAFSLLMAIPSAAAGSVAAVMLKKIVLRFNPQFLFQKAILLCVATALTVIAILYLCLYGLLNGWMTFSYPETLLFWFLLPSIIFFAVCVTGGSKINQLLKTQKLYPIEDQQ